MMEFDNTIVAIVCISAVGITGLLLGESNGLITAVIAGIAGIAGGVHLAKEKEKKD